MITHGGHNSIKEFIESNVKMLVYPHMEDNDQPGNAMRVELNHFGLRGNLKKDSTELIWKKIDLILKDNNPSKHNYFNDSLGVETMTRNA
jgi:UDP:flavonoid glycosyltransferase YjiC (YdhE family)